MTGTVIEGDHYGRFDCTCSYVALEIWVSVMTLLQAKTSDGVHTV